MIAALDDQPVLDEKLLKLALWMRERYFCTVYDGVKAMLPAGLYYALRDCVALRSGVDRAAAFEMARRELGAYLKSLGADVRIVLGEDLPRTHPESGKFRHIVSLGQGRGPAAQKL